MSTAPIHFSATGAIQQFRIPSTGLYVIEASGAQGGPGSGPGGKGARVKGTFKLKEGELLQIVVGVQGTTGTTPHRPAGGGGGGSFVWRGALSIPLPNFPLLAAGGGGGASDDAGGDGVVTEEGGKGGASGGREGHGGESNVTAFTYSGGGGAGWLSSGDAGSSPTFCGGGSIWRGGAGASYCCNVGGSGGFGGGGGGSFLGHGSGGGGGYSGGGGGTQAGPGGGGGGSYNFGVHQANTPGVQTGNGRVSLTAIPEVVIRPHASVKLLPARVQVNQVQQLEPMFENARNVGLDPDFLGFI